MVAGQYAPDGWVLFIKTVPLTVGVHDSRHDILMWKVRFESTQL